METDISKVLILLTLFTNHRHVITQAPIHDPSLHMYDELPFTIVSSD